ncbi:MAG: GNAT family N-acetyltransferase [Bdellovibrionales bacterium]|nr:GNAT family N-acetyltransferase [Bdellovibrionales bacterium]
MARNLPDDFKHRAESAILAIGRMGLWQGPIPEASPNGLIFPPTDPLKGIEEAPPSSVVVVAQDDNTIVGYMIIRFGTGLMSYSQGLRDQYGHLGQMAFVRSLAVAERYRGNNVTSSMMNTLLPLLSRYDIAFVGMHVRESPMANSAGKRAVKSCGFMRTSFKMGVDVESTYFGPGASNLIPTDSVRVDYTGYVLPVSPNQFILNGRVVTPEMCEATPLTPEGLSLVRAE